jgi:hypothetical protein
MKFFVLLGLLTTQIAFAENNFNCVATLSNKIGNIEQKEIVTISADIPDSKEVVLPWLNDANFSASTMKVPNGTAFYIKVASKDNSETIASAYTIISNVEINYPYFGGYSKIDENRALSIMCQKSL